jgi:hypothetical protein
LKFKHFIWLVLGACSLGILIRGAWPCSVPVFRYALERWKPEPYKGIVIYRNEITQVDEALFRQLEQAASNPEYPLNLLIRKVEVASFSEAKLKELLKGPIPEKLPALAIWYPDKMGKTAPSWILEFNPSIVKAFADSPKRRFLAKSLIDGESIVWIFVPSGNSEKDEKAKAVIRRELDLALNSLKKMPFFILAGSKEKRLTYGFPILTLSRTDPDERFFLDMLLKCESDLYEHSDEPMVFPVFGRGRVLGCLFGTYISQDKIEGVIAYLAGSCSCEVKALNPGTDLLVAAPWDAVVINSYVENTPMPELTGVMPDPPASKKQSAPDFQGSRGSKTIFANFGITLGSAVVVVMFASLVLTHRRRKD